MRKVLFICTGNDKLGDTGQKTGCYFQEVSVPYKILTQAGYDIDFLSPKGGKIPMIAVDKAEPELQTIYQDNMFLNKIENSLRPDQVKYESSGILSKVEEALDMKQVNVYDYCAIYFPGGHGTMWDLPDNKEIQRMVADYYEKGGVVAAVCHGPAGLVNIKLSNDKYLVQGKTITAFTNDEERLSGMDKVVPFLLETRLIEHGARFTKALPKSPNVEVEERLVTGQNPASSEELAQELLNLLKVRVC